VDRQIINRRYRLERKIGDGATAEVFLGFDIVLNRRVAIKVLRVQYAANRAFRIRFEREAQNAARLSHPNIISIYDVGEDHRAPYIVMEYLEGQTLREIIDAEGPFHPDDVAVLVEQVAAGLDFAHANGLIHRDIKPQNILVDRHGLAKIVDFGIAKGLSDSSLTETGSSLGTVRYISPEQASGLMATPESDIYALGVVAYEMLTGQLPFEADSAVGIAMRHLNDPPPDPTEINPDAPPEAADIVLQALEKNPARRFPTAGAFARALTDWRLYQASRRLAAKLVPQPTAAEAPDAVRPDLFETVPSIRSLEGSTRTEQLAPPQEFVGPAPPGAGRRGGRSWIAGLAVLALAAALLWYGFDLSDRLDTKGGEPEATATSQSAAEISDGPTATATALPTAASTQTAAAALVTVPELIGASRVDAEGALTAAGLTARFNDPESSDTLPEGAVISQTPAGGTSLAEGQEVELTLSAGPAPVDLGSLGVDGRPRDEVVDELTSAGLDVVLVEEGSATVPEGDVIRLEPNEEARPGDEVSVFVSVGDKVLVPASLQGQPLARARAALEDLGLKVSGEIAVPRSTLASAGIDDPAAQGITDGDVVGIQDNGARFGGWIDSGTSVTLIYYDENLAEPTIAPSA